MVSSADRMNPEDRPTMSVPTARFGPLLSRGVYVAPFMGPEGETIVFCIDHRHRIVGRPTFVSAGESHLAAADAHWARLDRDDPFYLEAI